PRTSSLGGSSEKAHGGDRFTGMHPLLVVPFLTVTGATRGQGEPGTTSGAASSAAPATSPIPEVEGRESGLYHERLHRLACAGRRRLAEGPQGDLGGNHQRDRICPGEPQASNEASQTSEQATT